MSGQLMNLDLCHVCVEVIPESDAVNGHITLTVLLVMPPQTF